MRYESASADVMNLYVEGDLISLATTESHSNVQKTCALLKLGGNYTGAGDQFASSISAAMGLEKTAADIESDAAATLLAGADEEGRLAEEMMSAKAKSVEGDTLKSAIGESAKVDKASLKEREIRAGMEAGLEKAAIDDKYKMLAPRVIGPKIPSLPGWIKSGSEKEVEVKSGTYGGTGDYRTTPKTGHDTL